jgi:hypothetical protein
MDDNSKKICENIYEKIYGYDKIKLAEIIPYVFKGDKVETKSFKYMYLNEIKKTSVQLIGYPCVYGGFMTAYGFHNIKINGDLNKIDKIELNIGGYPITTIYPKITGHNTFSITDTQIIPVIKYNTMYVDIYHSTDIEISFDIMKLLNPYDQSAIQNPISLLYTDTQYINQHIISGKNTIGLGVKNNNNIDGCVKKILIYVDNDLLFAKPLNIRFKILDEYYPVIQTSDQYTQDHRDKNLYGYIIFDPTINFSRIDYPELEVESEIECNIHIFAEYYNLLKTNQYYLSTISI